MAAARDPRGGRPALAAAIFAAAISLATPAAAQGSARPDSSAAEDSLRAVSPADSLGTVHVDSETGAPFRVWRVANPRYRPRVAGAGVLATPLVNRLRALDQVHAQIVHRGAGPASRLTQWDLSFGETYRNQDAIGAAASGEVTPFGSSLRALRMEGRRGALSGALGDMPSITIERVASLNRLRGGVVRLDAAPRRAALTAWGGGPTPLPRRPTPRLGVGGIHAQGVRVGNASGSFALVGFGRGAVHPLIPAGATPPDSLAGRGGEMYAGVRGRLPLGSLGVHLAAQQHDLDGRSAVAAREMVEWNFVTPEAALFLSEERAGGHTRIIGTEGLTRAAHREDRWNLQMRPFRGRAETHLTGVVRGGGEATLASQTIQIGASGNLGASPWYSGADYVWDWRALTGIEERRLTLHAGGVAGGGRAVSARLERTTNDAGRNALLLGGEASLPAGRGVRVALEPRVSWDGGVLRQADAATHVTWPLTWCAARVTATLAVGAVREEAFRGSLREASVAIAFAPRFRDRAELEVRSLNEGSSHEIETTASYDLTAQRYQGSGDWFSSRDSSRIDVVVARSGNGTGVRDVLVSLDGKDLRFTDEDGVAHFDRVPPGVHVVAIEEKSLPRAFEVVGATRVFVTVERGVPTDVARFIIARPERRIQFLPGGN